MCLFIKTTVWHSSSVFVNHLTSNWVFWLSQDRIVWIVRLPFPLWVVSLLLTEPYKIFAKKKIWRKNINLNTQTFTCETETINTHTVGVLFSPYSFVFYKFYSLVCFSQIRSYDVCFFIEIEILCIAHTIQFIDEDVIVFLHDYTTKILYHFSIWLQINNIINCTLLAHLFTVLSKLDSPTRICKSKSKHELPHLCVWTEQKKPCPINNK